MFFFNLIIIVLFQNLISKIKTNNNILTIPFTRKNNDKIKSSSLNDNELLQTLIQNNIFIQINIGTPQKLYELELKFQEYTTFITEKNSYIKNTNIETYNKDLSQSYKSLNNESRNFTNNFFLSGKRSIDLFSISKKKINEFYFIYVSKLKKDISTAGIIGLRIQDDSINELKQTNFITQLKKNNLINSYSFTIKYKNLYEGEIIFGEDIDYLIHNEKNNFQKTNVDLKKINSKWIIQFEKITYNDILIESDKIIILEIEFGLIVGSEKLRKELHNKFFEKKINNKECSINEFLDLENLTHIYYKCNKKTNLKEFKDIKFFNKDLNMNFTFTKNELFEEINNNLYFQIIFDKNQVYGWKFGKIFFNQYQIYFDQDKKIIGVLKSFKLGKREKLAWILVIILIIALIILGYFSYRIFILLPRRKRANELKDDNYEYISSYNQITEMTKKNDKNNLGINN
jgi:hypothetical protein